MPGSTISQSKKNYLQHVLAPGKSSDYKKQTEVLRNEMAKLKEELDIEKSKNRQSHRDKILELKKIRDEVEVTNKINLEEESIRLNFARDNEIRKIKETLSKEKEQQIKQIIKFKDEEIKTLQKTFKEEKDVAIKEAVGKISQSYKEKFGMFNRDTEKKLKDEIYELKKDKEQLEKLCKEHSFCSLEKIHALRDLKKEHDHEIQRILREARRENSRSVSELQKLKKTLYSKENEIQKLEHTKNFQQQSLHQNTSSTKCCSKAISNKNSLSMSDLNVTDLFTSGLENGKCFEDIQAENMQLLHKLEQSQKYVKELMTMKSESKESSEHTLEYANKIKDLKRRNNELVIIAKKLEEKARATEKKYNELKTVSFDKEISTISNGNISRNEDFSKLKSSFAIKRAKDKAEHAQMVIMKEKQLKQVDSKCKEMENALSVAEVERLRLEKQISRSPNLVEFESVQSELQEYKKQSDQQAKDLGAIRKAHDGCDEKIKKMLSKLKEMEELNTQLESKQDECIALSTNLTNNSMKTAHLEKLLREKEAECKNLLQENKQHTAQNEEYEISITQLNLQLAKVEQLKSEKREIEMQLLEATDKYERMADKVNDLEKEIHELKKNLLGEQRKSMSGEEQLSQVQLKLIERDQEIIHLRKLQQEASQSKESTINTLIGNLRNIEESYAQLSDENSALKEKVIQEKKTPPKHSQYTQVFVQKGIDMFTQTQPKTIYDKGTQYCNSECMNKEVQTFIDTSYKEIQVTTNICNVETQTEPCIISDGDGDSEDILEFASAKIDHLAVESTEDDISDMHGEDDVTDDTDVTDEKILNWNSKTSFKMLETKCSYNPEIASPNYEHTDELSFIKGDRLFAFNSPDQNGYYLAERKNGERGLVPSNLVHVLPDDNGISEDYYLSDENFTDAISDNQNHTGNHSNSDEYEASRYQHYENHDRRYTDDVNLSDTRLPKDIKEQTSKYIPPHPIDLRLDHKLNTSLVLSWNMPSHVDTADIRGYAIYCDDKLRQTVLGASRSKALISDVFENEAHMFSVSTVAHDGTTSDKEKCMLILKKGSSIAPFSLSVENVTHESANVTWKPSRNEAYHSIYLNNELIDTLRAGLHSFTFDKLTPNTTYRAIIEGKENVDDDRDVLNTCAIDWVTPSLTPPEPPLHFNCKNIDEDFFEFSWLPVTIKENGLSNGSVVTGYTIYSSSDGTVIARTNNPLEDSLQVSIDSIRSLGLGGDISVYIRTVTALSQSPPSNVVELNKSTASSLLNQVETDRLGDQVDSYRLVKSTSPNMPSSNRIRNSSSKENVDSDMTHARVYNPENEHPEDFLRHNDDNVERIIVSDDELSIIEEVSEEESSVRLSRSFSQSMSSPTDMSKFPESLLCNPKNDNFADIAGVIEESENVLQSQDLPYSTNQSQNDLNTLLIAKPCIATSQKLLLSESLNVSPLISERYLSGPATGMRTSGPQDDTLEKIESVCEETGDNLDNTISNDHLSDTMQDFYGKEGIPVNEIFQENENKETENENNNLKSEQQDEMNENYVNKISPRQEDIRESHIETNPLAGHLEKESVNIDTVRRTRLSDEENGHGEISFPNNDTVSLNALADTDNSYPITDSVESINDSIETFRYQPLARKKQPKDFLPSSIEEEIISHQGNESLIEKNELNNEHSHTDINQNNTYSINYEKLAQAKHNPDIRAPDDSRASIQGSKQLQSLNVFTNSTTHIDSAEVIQMIEKDAQRDILEDCPELPLDTSSFSHGQSNGEMMIADYKETSPSYNNIMKSNMLFIADEKGEESDKSLSSVGSEEDSLSSSYRKTEVQRFNDSAKQLFELTKNDLQREIRSAPKEDSIDDDSIETSDVSSVIATSEISSMKISSVVTSSISSADPTSLHISESDQSEIEALLNFKVTGSVTEKFPKVESSNSIEDENACLNVMETIKPHATDINMEAKPHVTHINMETNSKDTLQTIPCDISNDEVEDESVKNRSGLENNDSEQLVVHPSLHHVDEPDEISNEVVPTSPKLIVSPTSPADSDSSLNHEILNKSSENLYTFGASLVLSDSDEDAIPGDETFKNSDTHEEEFDFSVTPLSISNISKLTLDKQALDVTQGENNAAVSGINDVDEMKTDYTQKEDIGKKKIDIARKESEASQAWETFPNETSESNSFSEVTRLEENLRIFIAVYSYDPLTQSPNTEYADDELAFPGGALIRIYGEIDDDGFYFGEYDGKTGFIPGNMVKEIDVSEIDHALSLKDISTSENDDSALADQQRVNNFHSSHHENEVQADVSRVMNEETYDEKFDDNSSKDAVLDYKGSNISKSLSDLNAEYDSPMCNKKTVSMPDMMASGWNGKKKDPYRLSGQRMIALFDYDPIINSPNVDSEIELTFYAGDMIDVYGSMDEDGFYAGKLKGKKGLVPSNFIRIATVEDMSANGASSVEESPKLKKKNSILRKSKKIFSRLTGHK